MTCSLPPRSIQKYKKSVRHQMNMRSIAMLHMNIGDGESSYACNSFLQETAIRKALPVLKRTIKSITNLHVFFDQCFKIADLGCSSSKNTLLVASNIVDIVHEVCKENNRKPPQFQVCLNDLFGNDFNTIFKWLPNFYAKIKKDNGENFGPCFVSAVPGSFYGRLFPDQSLHHVHSSYGLHWLSQVPEGLENNASNIYVAKTSPPDVIEAYREQFYTDFTKLLLLRSEEIVCGGRMVLTFLGRTIADPTSDDCCRLLELLAQSLLDMHKEGMVQESDINSFNMPNYFPCGDEVRHVIHNQGSFSIDTIDAFQINWDPHDTDYTSMKDFNESSLNHGVNATKVLRAITEPMLTSHFGNCIIDMVYKKYEKHLAEHLANKKTRYFNTVISLTKT